jgi:sialic acid synthase SpsE
MRQDSCIEILGKKIGLNEPVYFIADIAANHDGSLQRAIDLIWLASEAGANAAKFQHFQAETIVSNEGFQSLRGQLSHQSKWGKSVFEVYQDASVDLDWTPSLKKACDKAGITFFTSPYSIKLVDAVDPYVPAYKIGSGDITWLEIIKYIAGKNKPYFLATGASTIQEVQKTVEVALKINPQLALLQCNTNYTASLENFKYIQLNVLKTYREMFPDLILGLSDHTPGHATVLGSVVLGARIIEKHFTDDTSRVGPDHTFSMDPASWREMVDRTRELECSLGTGVKKVENNEKETVILQRRSIRMTKDLQEGARLTRDNLAVLRPCPGDALPPYELDNVIGRQLKNKIKKGDYLKWSDIK